MLASQIWERRRRIPSATFNDPLDHSFTEFDEDGDGHLTATEIAHALQSRGVEADERQVQEFIDGEWQRCCCAAELSVRDVDISKTFTGVCTACVYASGFPAHAHIFVWAKQHMQVHSVLPCLVLLVCQTLVFGMTNESLVGSQNGWCSV